MRCFLMKILMLARCWLHAAVSGQACDANLVSEARHAYESNKVALSQQSHLFLTDEGSMFDDPRKIFTGFAKLQGIVSVNDS